MKTSVTFLLSIFFVCSLAGVLSAGELVYGPEGEVLAITVDGSAGPAFLPPPDPLRSNTIDSWDAVPDYEWGLNADFAWANVWDSNDISEPHMVTEIQFYGSPTLGVEYEFYMTTDNGGWPDDAQMTLLTIRDDLDGGGVFDWVSIDVSEAGYVVEPGNIYWLVRTCPIGGWPGFTWASAGGGDPPVVPPVKITQSFGSGGWFSWVSEDWWMLFRIFGDPEGLSLSVDQLVGGQTTTVSVTGADPYDTVIIGYSIHGGGPINTPWGVGYLTPPIVQLPWQTADEFGNVSLSATCPNFPGFHLWVQALDFQAGALSNGWDGIIE